MKNDAKQNILRFFKYFIDFLVDTGYIYLNEETEDYELREDFFHLFPSIDREKFKISLRKNSVNGNYIFLDLKEALLNLLKNTSIKEGINRTKLSTLLQAPPTTVFETLEHLRKRKLLNYYTEKIEKKRGRPRVYWYSTNS